MAVWGFWSLNLDLTNRNQIKHIFCPIKSFFSRHRSCDSGFYMQLAFVISVKTQQNLQCSCCLSSGVFQNWQITRLLNAWTTARLQHNYRPKLQKSAAKLKLQVWKHEWLQIKYSLKLQLLTVAPKQGFFLEIKFKLNLMNNFNLLCCFGWYLHPSPH